MPPGKDNRYANLDDRPLSSEEQVVLDLIQQVWGLGRESIKLEFDDEDYAFAIWFHRGHPQLRNLTIYGMELATGKITYEKLCEEIRGGFEDT